MTFYNHTRDYDLGYSEVRLYLGLAHNKIMALLVPTMERGSPRWGWELLPIASAINSPDVQGKRFERPVDSYSAVWPPPNGPRKRRLPLVYDSPFAGVMAQCSPSAR